MMMEEQSTNPATASGDKVSIPEGHSDSAKNQPRNENRKTLWIGLAIVFLVAVVLAISLPLTLKKDLSTNQLLNGNGSTPDNDRSIESTPDIDTSNGSTSETDTSNEGENTPAKNSDESEIEPLLVDANENEIYPLWSASELNPPLDIEMDDLYDLPLFSKEITQGYETTKEFDEAMTQAAWLLVKETIGNEVKNHYYREVLRPSAPSASRPTMGASAEMDMADAAPAMEMAETGSSIVQEGGGGGVTDFGTNNQEMGVDEADIIKADDNYMYAAYGDYIVVWDANGEKITQVAMPLPPSTQYYQPKARIESLLLTPGYLIVIVSGYQNTIVDQRPERPILYNYMGTQIRTYKISSLSSENELEFIGMKNINGRYLDARSIGTNVHLATVSGIDVYSNLISQLNRRQFPDLTDEEYVAAAQRTAVEKVIPDFVRKLRGEISDSGNLPNMLQINRWQTEVPENQDVANMLTQQGAVRNVALVTSFDVREESRDLAVSTSMFMSPSGWIHMYGTQDRLILATQGWNWMTDVEGEQQTTYLLGLSINGTSTEFISVGTVAGHLLNSFALDIVDNDLRVATTLRTRFFRWRPMPLPMPIDPMIAVAEPEIAIEAVPEVETMIDSDTDELEVETEMADADIMIREDEPEVAETIVLPRQVEPEVEPIEPEIEPPSEIVSEESSTENYVIVLELESDVAGQMAERGRVKIGEIHESIMAVRFFEDVAYVVTFERTDPFYVIDLRAPAVLGEFKLNGFSNYLHPMNRDNTLLIGVGQNATDDGRTTGLMITVFNATVPQAPVALVSHALSSRNGRSSSSAQWDHHAFRYVDGHLVIPVNEWYYTFDEESGEVLQHNFEGFSVFDVSTTAIEEKFRVSHFGRVCHYCAWLAERNFIYEGNLITVQNSVVKSTNLNTGVNSWTMDVVIDGEEASCCPYYLN